MTTKNTRIQLRRADLQATLEAINPVLLAGEPAIALDTGILKIGDGVSTYTQLPEIGASPDLSGYAQKAGNNTFSGNNNFTGDLQKNGVNVATTNDIPDISTLESTTNKVTSLSGSSTDTQYPSAKCVYDLVGDVESLLNNINSGS